MPNKMIDTQESSFTLEDRKELIRQGIVVDNTSKTVLDGFKEIKESMGAQGKRIRDVEDDILQYKAQVKIIMWFGGIIFTLINSIIGLALKFLIK